MPWQYDACTRQCSTGGTTLPEREKPAWCMATSAHLHRLFTVGRVQACVFLHKPTHAPHLHPMQQSAPRPAHLHVVQSICLQHVKQGLLTLHSRGGKAWYCVSASDQDTVERQCFCWPGCKTCPFMQLARRLCSPPDSRHHSATQRGCHAAMLPCLLKCKQRVLRECAVDVPADDLVNVLLAHAAGRGGGAKHAHSCQPAGGGTLVSRAAHAGARMHALAQ